jgi:hypothetical protein
MNSNNANIPKVASTSQLRVPPLNEMRNSGSIRKTQSFGSLWNWLSNPNHSQTYMAKISEPGEEQASDFAKTRNFSYRDLNAMSPTNW